MDWQILRPASADPRGPSRLPVLEFLAEKLKTTDVVVFPQNYQLSGDSRKELGEEAERTVIDHVQKCNIPGIKIVCFHHVRVIGGSPSILREVDFCCFVYYHGRFYILILEVKCNAISKKSGGTRKKANAQLKTFTEMLQDELSVQTDKLQTHAVWPRMDPTEQCSVCGKSHPSLYEKPKDCRQPGTQSRTNPDPLGLHLFKDKFDGDQFSKWVHGIVNDRFKAVEKEVFHSILQFITRHSVGVLYDETAKSFCILGKDQERLLSMSARPLDQPTVISGLAGTGKTIAIMARLQKISSQLSTTSKAIFLTFEENAIRMVKQQLEACNIDLTHITLDTFATFHDHLPDFDRLCQVARALIRDGYRYIYLDSVEDLGVDWVNKLLAEVLRESSSDSSRWPLGDFWVTFDPYQGLHDNHFLMKGRENQIRWHGNLARGKLANNILQGFETKRLVKLEDCFRMPLAMIDHIKSEKVLPTSDLPKAQRIKSLGVVEENINFPHGYSIQSLAEELATQLYTNVMQRGIHPGNSAVVFPGEAVDELFPPQQGGLSAFVQLVNDNLRAIPARRHANHMLQTSTSIEETLLFKSESYGVPSSNNSIPLLSESSNNVEAEDTAAFQMEGHNEVI